MMCSLCHQQFPTILLVPLSLLPRSPPSITFSPGIGRALSLPGGHDEVPRLRLGDVRHRGVLPARVLRRRAGRDGGGLSRLRWLDVADTAHHLLRTGERGFFFLLCPFVCVRLAIRNSVPQYFVSSPFFARNSSRRPNPDRRGLW